MSYNIKDLMNRRDEIVRRSVQIHYGAFENEGIGFDYEAMMKTTGLTFDEITDIQKASGVGNTPLRELKNISRYARSFAKEGFGARIFLKDEANNISGSFKARRAAISVYIAKKLGYKGVVAATSGNYGAAISALAAKEGLKAIIIQECFDSRNIAQPEILEKARACEAYGAEVIQLSVGPELFFTFLDVLDKTGYFNASLYSPYGIMGVETLGYEIAKETLELTGKLPDAVVCTNAGGGNLTGTARGLVRANSNQTKVIAASVNLEGLHMASDKDFNQKSFTTGHTGFGVPFAMNPDRSDLPRSAARPLRYMDEYYTINQGSVFFITEALSVLEGLERGPAGNTSLGVAFKLAQKMKKDEIIVVQESEYTGAGKHHQPQISFAKSNGIELMFGNVLKEKPGTNIIFPSSGFDIQIKQMDLTLLRKSYLKKYLGMKLTNIDKKYLCEELNINIETLEILLSDQGGYHERT